MKSSAERETSADDGVAGQAAQPEDDAAAAPEASSAAGGGSAQTDLPPAVSGNDLADALEAAAVAAGESIHHFLAPIRYGLHGPRYIEQLRCAKRPKPRTIERIRAFLRGELPEQAPGPQYAGGTEGSLNNEYAGHRLRQANQERERQRDLHRAAELGRALRQPGETLAESVRREADDLGERRRDARKLSATVHDPIDLRKVSPSYPKARKYEPLPPDTWAALKRLADETGEAPMALLPIVVERGIESLRAAQ